jgi:hypothetical protein
MRDPLISPASERAPDHPVDIGLPPDHNHAAHRRRRRRVHGFRPRRERRRILRTTLLCSVVLLVMAAGLYAVLTQSDHNGSGSALPARGPALVG